jgi:hypothetical protein
MEYGALRHNPKKVRIHLTSSIKPQVRIQSLPQYGKAGSVGSTGATLGSIQCRDTHAHIPKSAAIDNWHTRGSVRMAFSARPNSPPTTVWGGGGWELRFYFRNENRFGEAHGTHFALVVLTRISC